MMLMTFNLPISALYMSTVTYFSKDIVTLGQIIVASRLFPLVIGLCAFYYMVPVSPRFLILGQHFKKCSEPRFIMRVYHNRRMSRMLLCPQRHFSGNPSIRTESQSTRNDVYGPRNKSAEKLRYFGKNNGT